MKIVLFNTFYAPILVGGAEVSVQLLAEGLVKAGNTVYVVTIGDEERREIINGVEVLRLRHRNIFSPYMPKKYNKLVSSIWLLLDSFNPFYHKKIKTLLGQIKPDIVHTNNVMGFSPSIWRTIKKLDLPLVHTMRDYYLICHKCNLFNNGKNCNELCKPCAITYRIKKKCVNQPDAIIGISNYILTKHQQFLEFSASQRTGVVFNAVDIPERIDFEKRSSDEVVFGYMGRVAADKGVKYMLDELQTINRKYPGKIRVLIAGKGELEFIKTIEENFNHFNCSFLGMMTPSDFYRKVDVAIVPSMWQEPFGRVVIEALAHSVPVILSDSGGLSELHHTDNTWMFKMEENGLANVVEEILKRPSLISEKKANSRKYASEFNVNVNVKNYYKIYQDITASSK